GRVVDSQAREEIFGGKHEVEQHLGAPVELFAYPYGRSDNIVDSNRDLVKAAGFRCCCSCFGGINSSRSDPFHLARIPISPWYSSLGLFGFEVALGRSVTSYPGTQPIQPAA